jgi:hypothetical protein
MTLASDIVTAAFREGNIIPVGRAPSGGEQVEGLQLLNRFMLSVYGLVLGEYLSDWQVPYVQRVGDVAAYPPYLPGGQRPLIVPNNQYPGQNSRIVWDGTEQTVYFPETPGDGARMAFVKASGAGASGPPGVLTLNGNGRTIEGSNIYVASSAARAWIYRADLAGWLAMVPLLLTDTVPFPEELDDVWIVSTFIRLAPRYGKAVSAETAMTQKRLMATLKTRYTQTEVIDGGGTELTGGTQSYGPQWWLSDFQF